ncbi:BQ5605_C019g08889 [Microbotryum silenes-dioicae]|uniref:BQ5605_C019g08889 protein n=1 Tax=Microbotryum silenes-dioicae TaxID=796604 RepID=A0A2X0MHT8_9BASI|nr:BQ5605_C019g08889 [Microbotryum silenes-dioicae]
MKRMELTQAAHTDKRPRTNEDMDIDKAPKSTCPHPLSRI